MHESEKSQIDLKLDETSRRPSKTRNELYKELTKDDKVMEEEDYYEFSNPISRGIALVIDSVFAFIIVNISLMLAPIEVRVAHAIFLDKYNLQFMFGDKNFLNVLEIMNIATMLFFFVVIPVAFFNVSLGKKLTKLRIRGDHKYTLNIEQAFKREIIYKPLGMLCIVGFILPFFNKKKKSLHDKWTGTFVIKE